MIKKISFALLFALPLMAHAGIKGMTGPTNDSEALKAAANAEPTYIHNNTNIDLAYMVHGSTIFNNIYAVGRNNLDIYHAGGGDDFAYIQIAKCDDFEFPDKCNTFGVLKSCSNSYYDVYKVSDITINPNMTCTIRCRDGSNTSCKK